LGGEPPKKVTVASTIQSASHPPPTGAIVSAAPAVTDALQYYRQAAIILESLKDREIDQEGNPLFLVTRFFLPSSFTDLDSFRSIVLVKDLETAQKALSAEQSADQKLNRLLLKRGLPNKSLNRSFNNRRTLMLHCPSSLIMLKLPWL
jgi:hypothetical protein